jgi:hypothetical protein
VLETQKCKYREGCTFAYCQEEVDVWTLERKGALNRELLFDSQSPNNDRLSITCLLKLHNGMFMYLCEVGHTHTCALTQTRLHMSKLDQ